MTDSIGDASDVIVSGRPFNPANDEAFIYSTWRNGLFYGSLKKDEYNADEFFPAQTAKIKQILSNSIVRIACIKDAPDVILGYAVFTGDYHLEWIFVKLQFRGKRIATFLTPRMNTVSEDLTKIGAAIVKKKELILKRSPLEEPSTSKAD